MALVKCPECGKEISNRAKNCVHCGNPLDMQESNAFSNINNEINNENYQTVPVIVNNPKQRKLSKGVKVVVAIIAVVVLVFGIVTLTSNSFSDEEEYGLKIVTKYQDMLKNPDSLILRSDIAVISYYRNGKTYKYVFFDASGENSYGAYEMCKQDYPPILEELRRKSFETLLDAGCGTAPMLSMLTKEYPDRYFVGLDLTPEMIAKAKAKNLPNTELVVGDCEDLPFEPETFDVVINSQSFHHYPNPPGLF